MPPVAATTAAAFSTKTSVSANAPSQADLVKRGDYLVNTMGCGDCQNGR